jgi:hypothetical protein
MKKRWVELAKGNIIEVSGVRSVNAGSEGTRTLYVKFVGDRGATSLTFDSEQAKWKAYDLLWSALQKLNEAFEGNGKK